MKIVPAKSSVTLWTLPLSCLVSGFDAIHTEHMEAFGKHGILVVHIATGTSKLRLKAKHSLN